MKKIFTCISLAAATFMATTPVMAQQQKQISDQEKEAFVKAAVPAIFDQVKQISGIDFMGLTNPNIETVLNSPLFGTQGMLRAATSTPISIQPDSMNINLSEVDINGIPATVKPMLANIKLKFADYKDYTMTTANGQTIEISVPLKVTASALDGFISCGVNFSVGEKKGLLPFSSFTANLDLGDLEALLTSLGMTNIKSGTLVSMTETGSNAVYNYDIKIGESLRGITAISKLPNFQISIDMTKMQSQKPTINASLKGIITNGILPMGDAVVYLNPQATVAGTITPDSTILTSYVSGTVNVDKYKKLVQNVNVVNSKKIQTRYTTYEKKTLDATWSWEDASMTTIQGNQEINPQHLASSILNGVFTDLVSGSSTSFNMSTTEFESEADSKGITTFAMEVVPSMVGTQAAKATIKMSSYDDEAKALKASMNIDVTMPLKNQTITVDFTPADYTAPVGTMYIKSNAMGIITDNETIENDVEEVKVSTTASGLYVKNGKGNYVIVNMVGKVVSTGIITSDEQYISTPNMPNGIYMISIDQSKLLRSAHKTTVKFVK